MDDREQQRKVRHRLAVLRHAEEVTGSVSATCRYYGVSRQVFYKWRRRFEEEGESGLRDRSSVPFNSPNATKVEVVGKIMYLRQHYHFGPQKISMYLKRYHDVQIGHSGVYRVLKRVGLNRLPASQRYKRHTDRWKRYEKPLPGHRVQVDVKFIEPLPGTRKKHYQYTAIDDCTRIRVLRIYPRNDQKTAIQFLDYVLEKLPFQVEVVQTDNGAEFQGALHWHLLDRGIGHVYIKPATPPPQWKGRAIPPHRRRGVLPNARRRRDRRHRALQRQAARVGELLQLRPPTRGPQWTDPLRTTTTKDQGLRVNGLHQLHN
jgi:transposase